MISERGWKTDNGAQAAETKAEQEAPSPVDALLKHFAELRAYALLYLETRKDQLQALLRRGMLLFVLGIVVLLAATSAVVTAMVLLMTGVARGLGVLLGGHFWAGEILVGAGMLAAIGAGLWLSARAAAHAARQRLADKYAQRRAELHARFRRDLSSRAKAGDEHV